MRVAGLRDPLYEGRPQVYSIYKACYSSAKRFGHVKVVSWEDGADRLILWGIGNDQIAKKAAEARKRGMALLIWDLAYFRRSGPIEEDKGYRLSINEFHPTSIVMARDRPSDRWERLGIATRNVWDPKGPIVLVGMGRKSAPMYGEGVGIWENKTAAKIRREFPGRKLIFRPKPGHPGHTQSVPGVPNDYRPIQGVLEGASLVVCRHSNVGVDALIAGIPSVTWGGAAAAIFPSTLDGGNVHVPVSNELRDRFLHNLAWFEWSPREMRRDPTFWPAVESMIEDYGRGV